MATNPVESGEDKRILGYVKAPCHRTLLIVGHGKSYFARWIRLNVLRRLAFVIALVCFTLFELSIAHVQGQARASGKSAQILPARDLPLTKFYSTPDPLPAGNPGDLIRSQQFDEYELPTSVSTVRILYHSRSAGGQDVAVSGVVVYPYGKKPPARGWPVIAWAHGTNGVGRLCAPSLTRNLEHGPFLAMYVNLGYAVVATDYAGLGTHFRNAFLDGPSNATDVINSVPAARSAVPQLSTRWIVMGEAEGGLAALAVADKENEIRDPNYLGAIAISVLVSAKEIYEHASNGPSSMLPSLAYGIKTVFPQFQAAEILTKKGIELYNQLEQTCSPTRTIREASTGETGNPGWENNSFVLKYSDRSDFGRSHAYGPILFITRDADPAIPPALRAQAFDRVCKEGDQVQWERYPGLDAGTVLGDSVRDQIAWIEARFAGRPATTNCS